MRVAIADAGQSAMQEMPRIADRGPTSWQSPG
jgi:hypothetical protein